MNESEERRLRDNWAEAERKVHALLKQQYEVEQILGRALGYAEYGMDQPNVDGTPSTDVCVGEHTIVTLAQEASLAINFKPRYVSGWPSDG